VAPAILTSVICRRLPAIPIETVIDSIWPTRHWENNTIGRNGRTGIKIRRAVVVEEDVFIIRVSVPLVVPDVHFRGE
jgi:hypothetical protein